MYLHALGPALQWIDVTFIHRGFRALRASAVLLLGFIGLYVVWIEVVLQTLGSVPSGSVTSGLPYRFLNDLDLAGRASFYLGCVVSAIVFLLLFTAIAAGVRRLLPAPKAP